MMINTVAIGLWTCSRTLPMSDRRDPGDDPDTNGRGGNCPRLVLFRGTVATALCTPRPTPTEWFSGTQWNKPALTPFILRATGHRAGQGCERSTEADQDAHSRWRHAFRCRRPCSLRSRGKGDQGLKRDGSLPRRSARSRNGSPWQTRSWTRSPHSSHRRVQM